MVLAVLLADDEVVDIGVLVAQPVMACLVFSITQQARAQAPPVVSKSALHPCLSCRSANETTRSLATSVMELDHVTAPRKDE